MIVSDRLSGWIGQPGHAHDRQPGLRRPLPAEVVGHAHRSRRVARHGVDAAVRRAGADRDDRCRLGRQPVEPLGGLHRLPGHRVVPERGPVALLLDRLVGDRTLDHQHERLELAAVGLVPPLDEVVGALLGSALEVDQRPVDRDLRKSRQGPQDDLLDARLGGSGEGDRVAVAAEPAVHPEDVDDTFVRPRHSIGSRSRRQQSTRTHLCSRVAPDVSRARPALSPAPSPSGGVGGNRWWRVAFAAMTWSRGLADRGIASAGTAAPPAGELGAAGVVGLADEVVGPVAGDLGGEEGVDSVGSHDSTVVVRQASRIGKHP